jgi:hypothetical protein
LSPFGLGESVLKPLFSGSHWVSRTSACENCCCDFLLSLRIDVCQRDAPPQNATTTCNWNRGYASERSGRKVSRKRCHDGEHVPGEQALHRRRFMGISPIVSAIRLRAQAQRTTRRVRAFPRGGCGAIRDWRRGNPRRGSAHSVVRARERLEPWSRQKVSGRSETAAAPMLRWLSNRTRQSEAAAGGSSVRRTTRSVRRAIPT